MGPQVLQRTADSVWSFKEHRQSPF
jgi:hypothetical protein